MRNVSMDQQGAEQKFAAMVASGMAPRKTSGIWFDDSPEREWLVIYAGQRIGEDNKTIYHDGFMVESPSFLFPRPKNI
jgi:hypothetical protein